MKDKLEMKVVECRGCKRVMLVKEEPLQEWIVSLGYKPTDRWWHDKCLDAYLNGRLILLD